MIEEIYIDYKIIALPVKTKNNKWSVAVKISRKLNEFEKEKYFEAKDKIEYVLEIEAAKESINLGKNIIKNNMISF